MRAPQFKSETLPVNTPSILTYQYKGPLHLSDAGTLVAR